MLGQERRIVEAFSIAKVRTTEHGRGLVERSTAPRLKRDRKPTTILRHPPTGGLESLTPKPIQVTKTSSPPLRPLRLHSHYSYSELPCKTLMLFTFCLLNACIEFSLS